MKRIPFHVTGALFVWFVLMTVNIVLSQTIVTHTTPALNAEGVIRELGPETLIIRGEGSPISVSFDYSRKTLYVDETGAPISVKTVKLGLPVTVYYSKVGEKLVATTIMVRKPATMPNTSPVKP